MLKLLYCKNRFSISKIDFFSIIELPCITITTGVHNFSQVKNAYGCVVMRNEYIHVCTKRFKSL